MADINRVMNGYLQAKDAAQYVEAITLEEELISGDDYRLVMTSSYDGKYPIEKLTEV